MNKKVEVFIVVLISIGIADFSQGIILTSLNTPNPYSTSGQEMATFLQYIISAITVTLALWSVHKVKFLSKSSESLEVS